MALCVDIIFHAVLSFYIFDIIIDFKYQVLMCENAKILEWNLRRNMPCHVLGHTMCENMHVWMKPNTFSKNIFIIIVFHAFHI